jgi:hypothetical protein
VLLRPRTHSPFRFIEGFSVLSGRFMIPAAVASTRQNSIWEKAVPEIPTNALQHVARGYSEGIRGESETASFSRSEGQIPAKTTPSRKRRTQSATYVRTAASDRGGCFVC